MRNDMSDACQVQTCDLITDAGDVKMSKIQTLEWARLLWADAAYVYMILSIYYLSYPIIYYKISQLF